VNSSCKCTTNSTAKIIDFLKRGLLVIVKISIPGYSLQREVS
jgi:hypothetical protein